MKTKKRILSLLLGLALVFTLMPGMSMTVRADGTTYNPASSYTDYSSLVYSDTKVKIEGVKKGEDTVEWYVIGYQAAGSASGTGIAPTAGAVTLLAASNLTDSVKFNSDYAPNPKNKYKDSALQQKLDGLLTTMFAGVADALKERTLSATNALPTPYPSENYKQCDDIYDPDGNSVSAKLWPLSAKEATTIQHERETIINTDRFWFRSPGNMDDNVAYIISGTIVSGLSSNYDTAARPALQLDLSKVIFDKSTNTFSMPVRVDDISLDKTKTTLPLDGKETLTATISPDNASDKTVKWSVAGTEPNSVKLYSDESCTTEVGNDATDILTVYTKGISSGTATVTVTSNADNTKKASCNVTVNKPGSKVTKAPEAKTLSYTGSAQELVTSGAAENGTMQYARVTDATTVPTEGWSASIPTATDAGTYYVWYKAKGDDGYTDSEAAYVEAKINSPEPGKSSIKNDSTLPEAEKDKAYDVTFELEESTITDLNWEVTKGSLPEGLSLDSKTGKMTGKPVKEGEYTFTIREKTSGAEKEFSLTVKAGEEPGPEPSAEIKNDSTLPEAKQDADYDVTLELKDSSVQDMSWEITKGALPEGLSLDSRTGRISGKPAKEGEYEFTIKESKTGAEKEFKLTVNSSGSKKEEKKSGKRDTEEHKTASWILNPNEKQQLVITFTGTPAYLAAGYQEQGAAAVELFKAAVPAGWVKAFSFNVLDQKRQPDLSIKNGTMTLFIPGEYIKAGRQFALLGMNKAGQVILFADTDRNPNTVTVSLVNMDGYAFDLIHKD